MGLQQPSFFIRFVVNGWGLRMYVVLLNKVGEHDTYGIVTG